MVARIHVLVSAVALLVVPLGCTPRKLPARDQASTIAEVRAALARSAEAWNRDNLDEHVAVYADSATVMSPAGPLRTGPARARKHFARYFSPEGRALQHLRLEHVEVRPLGLDHALVTGRYVLSGGGRPERAGWFSLTWARTADGWRIVHDHAN